MNEEIYYDNNVYNSGEYENPNKDKKGFAIAALILGIISVVCCCVGLGFIAAPLSIIFAIIALVKHHGGTAMSVIGLVLSSIALFFMIIVVFYYNMYFKGAINDYIQFIEDCPGVIDEYEETGEIPDYLEKYTNPEYDDFWNSAGYDDFYEFFDAFVTEYHSSGLEGSYSYNNTYYDNGLCLS